jgi:hypothetical protein
MGLVDIERALRHTQTKIQQERDIAVAHAWAAQERAEEVRRAASVCREVAAETRERSSRLMSDARGYRGGDVETDGHRTTVTGTDRSPSVES